MLEVSIRGFQSEDARAFAEINYQWIETYFSLESKDEAELNHPE